MQQRRLISLLFITLFAVCAHAGQGTIEVEWGWERYWANPDARQPWVTDQNGQVLLSAEVSVHHNGLTGTVQADEKSAALSELYYEQSTDQLDYSIGLREQEWAYAYYQSQLDWLDEKHQVAVERFFNFGSGQIFCQTDDGLCGIRVAGWYKLWDWQWLVGHQSEFQTAAGLQRQFGQGGLIYIEGAVQQDSPQQTLVQNTQGNWQVARQNASVWQINSGLQWTTAQSLTVQGEWIYHPSAYQSSDWEHIRTQLTTPSAALVADAFRQPLSQHSFLLRAYWQKDKIALENIFLYWPQAQHTVLNEMTVEYELTASLTSSIEWHHVNKRSALGEIGHGNSISFSLTLKDGW